MRRLAHLAAFAVLATALAGCVVPAGNPGLPPGFDPFAALGGGSAPAPGLWAPAAARHQASAVLDAAAWEVRADALLPRIDVSDVTWVPAPGPSLGPVGAPPEKVVFQDAVVEGVHGTVTGDFADGVRVRSPGDAIPVLLQALRVADGAARGNVLLHGLLPFPVFDDPCAAEPEGDQCRAVRTHGPAPLPPELRSAPRFDLRISLGTPFEVTARNLTFHPAGEAPRALGRTATLERAHGVLVTGAAPLLAPAVEVRVPLPAQVLWQGNLTVAAEGARGEVDLGDGPRAVEGARFEGAWRTAPGVLANLTLGTSEVGGARVAVERADVLDLLVAGAPRLGARVAALPQVLDVEGAPGDTARMRAHRVEGPLEVRFQGTDPFPVTDALLGLAQEVSDPENPIESVVTVTVLSGIGIALPWFMMLEGFVDFVRSVLGVSLEGAVLPAGEAHAASFLVTIPEQPTTATLVLESSNAPPQRVELRVRPTASG